MKEHFPTTDEEMKTFLETHPMVEVPEKYKTPDWLFEQNERNAMKPKRNFRKLYEAIVKSEWFKKAYHGKSLGDFIPVDN